MYLHIGNDVMLDMGDIIGIFDLENTTITKQGRKFINSAQANGEVKPFAGEDMPRTYVITERGGRQSVYLSSIYSHTLKKRADTGEWLASALAEREDNTGNGGKADEYR